MKSIGHRAALATAITSILSLDASNALAAKPKLLTDVNAGTATSLSAPAILGGPRFTAFDDALYFSAQPTAGSGDGVAPFVTDGTATGTRKLAESPPKQRPGRYVRHGNDVFFDLDSSLWRTDGSPSGTKKVIAIPARLSGLASTSKGLFFGTDTHIWKSDGTEAGRSRCRRTYRSGY